MVKQSQLFRGRSRIYQGIMCAVPVPAQCNIMMISLCHILSCHQHELFMQKNRIKKTRDFSVHIMYPHMQTEYIIKII